VLVLLYIFILSFAVPITYCYLAERHFLSRIVQRESLLTIPTLTIGRRLNAFTIEKTHIVEGSVVLTMNFLRRYKLYWLRIFYGATTSVKWLIDMAQREALIRVKEAAKDATYIINLRFTYSHTNKNEIEVVAYGTAIQLYADTLGIYFLPELPNVYHPFTKQSSLFRNYIFSMIVIFGLLFSAITGERYLANDILNNLSDQDEKVFWQYLSTSSAISDRNSKQYLVETENSLQAILDSVPKADSLKNLKVILVDAEDKKLSLLPDGHIVIYKGILRQVKSENELFFLFAHVTQHYLDKSHIKNMGTYIITPYMFIKAFGDDSFFAKWIVRMYPFYNIDFSDNQEQEANKSALELLNKQYGHVGGIENTSSVFTHSSTDAIVEYAKKNNYVFKDVVAVTFQLDEPQIFTTPINVIPHAQDNKDYKDVVDEFRTTATSTLSKYQQAMLFMPSVLDPKSITSKEDITQKLSYIDFGFSNIDFYRNSINATIDEYTKKINELLAETKDDSKLRILNSIWQSEVDNINKIATFYFNRDYEILKTQQGALNFLNNRIGKFSTSSGSIQFRLKNDQDSYDGLMQRLQEQYAKPSPQTTNKVK
jgi:uncharacterized protein YbjQ (UPF0145 family)